MKKLSEKAVFFMPKLALNKEKKAILKINLLKTSSLSIYKILSSEMIFFSEKRYYK
jgi:hypothetical protein